MAAKKVSRKKRVSADSVSPAELLRELPAARQVTFERGNIIFREGSVADCCYVITSGKIQILKRIRGREELALGFIKPGEFLGEMAMFSSERRSASAVAVTKVKAIEINHAQFVSLLREQHPFASRLSLQICSLLATRHHHLLRLIARRPETVPFAMKKVPPIDVRAVLNRVYTLWAV